MADLPAEQITPAKPFHTCGLDLPGPIYTKPGVKSYIAIFVCWTDCWSDEGSMFFGAQEIHCKTSFAYEDPQW